MRTFFGVAFALLVAACASLSASDPQSKYGMGMDEYGSVPAADPHRLVNVQDCTRRITIDGGNLSCK
jgi:hypothetical protein